MRYSVDGISFTHRRFRRAKNIRIHVSCDAVVVTTPLRAHAPMVRAFLREKTAWILRAQKQLESARALLPWQGTRQEYEARKEEARDKIMRQVVACNAAYGFRYKRIGIRNQKTRWGSCSAAGSLHFNYKLIFLPADLIDYVVVHELCHLVELNHGRAFWVLVERAVPDYRLRRKRLRRFCIGEG